MKELQEEYLFLNRTGINGWADVFHAKSTAERKIADIDAKKKELYNENVPKLEQEQISYLEYNSYEEKTVESEKWIYEAETMSESTPEAVSIL